MRHDKDTETEGRQNARQDERQCFCLTPKEMMKPPKLCPTKSLRVPFKIVSCGDSAKGADKPNHPSSRGLGLWLPSRESTRANDVQAELAWNPSALTSMGECVVDPDTTKIEKNNDDGHRSFRAVPELRAAQKPDP